MSDDLKRLARDLGHLAGPATVLAATAAVDGTALLVKNGWNGKLYREGHADRTGRSITYTIGTARQLAIWQTDLLTGPDEATIVAEIGPLRGRGKQAGIVRLLENGSAHNAPHGYGAGALQEHEAAYEAALDAAVRGIETAAGLA